MLQRAVSCFFILFFFLQAFNKAIHPSTMKISNKLLRTAIWGGKKLAGFLQIKGQLHLGLAKIRMNQIRTT